MGSEASQPGSCTWRITTATGNACYAGTDSEELLSDLFSMWLHDLGDISAWENAAHFGAIIVEYSTLSEPVVATWLGIDEFELRTTEVPLNGPPWEMEGPNGSSLKLTRETGYNDRESHQD